MNAFCYITYYFDYNTIDFCIYLQVKKDKMGRIAKRIYLC